jgi:predicted Zn-dependent protease
MCQCDRFVSLPDGGQFQCSDNPLLDRLPQEGRTEGLIAWLEAHIAVAVACVALTVSVLFAGYSYGLPAAAEWVAARISFETEQSLGEEVLAWLDDRQWLTPTGLERKVQLWIQESFVMLCDGLPLERHYRLALRDSDWIGANALALPGGTIVITDDMVKVSRSLEEVLAVLAHEIGHVELRHSLRHLLQDSAVAVAAAAITSDAASLSVAVNGLPVLLTQAKYSREFESEADEYAFELLKKRDISPEAFADIMERLAKEHEDEGRAFAFLSTHPVTSERVQRARDAADGHRGEDGGSR